jgi:uncharacterized protein YndB with AHSA1/START domain
MESTTEVTSLRRELSIEASPETVWELLVDPEQATAGWACMRPSSRDPAACTRSA